MTIAIFQHAETEGPGYLAQFLDARQLPWRLIRIDQGETVPQRAQDWSGLVFMGGPMSVNDDLPWIPAALTLIREAAQHDIPVLGHCLGGQLMAKALGGSVTRNAVKEIGWGTVHVADSIAARDWFGAVRGFTAFHWHGETFSLPPQATHLLSSPHCRNQAFAIGKHLGMQCHIEMTSAMIRDWCRVGADELAESASSPAVQSASQMQAQMDGCLPALHQLAEQVYSQWVQGLAQP
ncbi:MAG TPA: type 1 glutamine amidotransferase [Gallionellaceae bacterium]|nr:type 1 glutamine amidotransferase [Gallionellaceae bacterium]